MSETQGQEDGKLAVSPLGTFLVGLFLGSGIVFTYHAISTQRSERAAMRTKDEMARLEKSNRELRYEIASTALPKPR
jgi:1,4-dihydroxy-2-naphthoate octaprenyltransferase